MIFCCGVTLTFCPFIYHHHRCMYMNHVGRWIVRLATLSETSPFQLWNRCYGRIVWSWETRLHDIQNGIGVSLVPLCYNVLQCEIQGPNMSQWANESHSPCVAHSLSCQLCQLPFVSLKALSKWGVAGIKEANRFEMDAAGLLLCVSIASPFAKERKAQTSSQFQLALAHSDILVRPSVGFNCEVMFVLRSNCVWQVLLADSRFGQVALFLFKEALSIQSTF